MAPAPVRLFLGSRRFFSLALLLSAAALLGACSSEFTYVKNPDGNTFFKVPKEWNLVVREQPLPPVTGAPLEQQVPQGNQWIAEFDADPRPRRGADRQGLPRYPNGVAHVRPLSDEERDGFSLAVLRNVAFPIDQLVAQQPDRIRILRNEDLVLKDGFRGSRIIFSYTNEEGRVLTVNQTAMVDVGTTSLYLLLVQCEQTCYLRHHGTIDQVVKSWTVTER